MRSLKKHATEMTIAAPYLIVLALILFVVSLRFATPSFGYLLTAAFTGVIELPLIWAHWRKPNGWLFGAIIIILIFSESRAKHIFFGKIYYAGVWWHFLQYLCVFTGVLLSLVFLLRRRILASIKEPEP